MRINSSSSNANPISSPSIPIVASPFDWTHLQQPVATCAVEDELLQPFIKFQVIPGLAASRAVELSLAPDVLLDLMKRSIDLLNRATESRPRVPMLSADARNSVYSILGNFFEVVSLISVPATWSNELPCHVIASLASTLVELSNPYFESNYESRYDAAGAYETIENRLKEISIPQLERVTQRLGVHLAVSNTDKAGSEAVSRANAELSLIHCSYGGWNYELDRIHQTITKRGSSPDHLVKVELPANKGGDTWRCAEALFRDIGQPVHLMTICPEQTPDNLRQIVAKIRQTIIPFDLDLQTRKDVATSTWQLQGTASVSQKMP